MNIEEIIARIEELRNGSFKANDWKFYLEEFVFSPDLLAILRQAQGDRAVAIACQALFDAPHQEHFAVRLNDEEMAALDAMKAAVPKGASSNVRP